MKRFVKSYRKYNPNSIYTNSKTYKVYGNVVKHIENHNNVHGKPFSVDIGRIYRI